VIEALHKRRMARTRDIQAAYSFILTQLCTNNYTVIDLGHLATVLGKQRQPIPSPSSVSRAYESSESSNGSSGGTANAGNGDVLTDVSIGETVAQITQEIEDLSCVHLRDGSMEPRQLASILWMFGRLGVQPSKSEFRGLMCVFIRERVRRHARLNCMATPLGCAPVPSISTRVFCEA
jgi:hypothetical protein